MMNVFVPHRWNNEDFSEISQLLDRTKYRVRDYSVPKDKPLPHIDQRYKVDPQIKNRIRYASVVVCSNRPANNNGMSLDEIEFALSIGKPVVAVKITDNTSSQINDLGIEVVHKRKDSLESWINKHVV